MGQRKEGEGRGGRDAKEEYVCPVPHGSSAMMFCPEECTLKQSQHWHGIRAAPGNII